MKPDEILELEMSLLLIKYGEGKVITSLSKLIGLKSDDLKSKLQKINQVKNSAPTVKNRPQVIDEIIERCPNKAHLLKNLYDRYQNKSFLPELRDIKRLLNRHFIEIKTIKSRNNAAKRVFDLLCTLDEKDLNELAQQRERTNISSLGIISDEILRHKD